MNKGFKIRWDLSPSEAIAHQKQLAKHLILEKSYSDVAIVAGVDVGFEQDGAITRAAVSLLSYPDLKPLENSLYRCKTTFPYIPGLLSFREIPAIEQALSQLKNQPDILLCDGQGYAHPRRLGIACHLGLLTGIPSIGVGKSRLIGKHDDPPNLKGAWVPLIDRDETIGAVLRTRVNVKPLYISPGHLIDLENSIEMVMACVTRFKLPETTRAAHNLASNYR